MACLTSSRHLYQPVKYSCCNDVWNKSFIESVSNSHGALTWDISAIASILCFGYPCSDNTLFKEIRRIPWLSKIDSNNAVMLDVPPEHNTLWIETKQIASRLLELLTEEGLSVCKNRKEIYILLSGGLDSRLVGGVISKLYQKGMLSCKPVGVTWGMNNSRDVAYGKAAAEVLGFDWQYIDVNADTLRDNMVDPFIISGGLVSPLHFHAMSWFKNVSKDALVLAGSYGDSVGRAEFSGRHLLELDYHKPFNLFGLLREDVFADANKQLQEKLNRFHQRFGEPHKYIMCEYEQQGHYMRGMISQAMNIINSYCTLYQMFTAPEVYGYMWSIHPSLRTDQVYAAAFEMLDSNLARLPWARTNKALTGATVGASSVLLPDFHAYAKWVSGSLFSHIDEHFDPQWLSETIGCKKESACGLREMIKNNPDGTGAFGRASHEKWIWLASLRNLHQHLKRIQIPVKELNYSSEIVISKKADTSLSFETKIKKLLSSISPLYSMGRIGRGKMNKLRRRWLLHRAKYLYAPKVKKN